MSAATLCAATETWTRLWRYGVNGDNIRAHNSLNNNNKKHNKQQNTRRSKRSKQSKQPLLNYNNPDPEVIDTSGSDRTKQKRTKNSTKAAKQKTLYQYSLLHRNITKEDVEEFGDVMTFPRPESVLQIVQQNVGNLPANEKASKSRQFINFIRRSQASVFNSQEIGLCLRKLPDKDQWCERVFGRLASSSASFAYNTTELANTSVHQPGGVGVISTDDVTHRVIQRGRDPTELGRWSWTLLEGKQHHRTRIITAYRPCASSGPGTVNQQHQQYYHRKHRDVDP
jgi:hypothetical protein